MSQTRRPRGPAPWAVELTEQCRRSPGQWFFLPHGYKNSATAHTTAWEIRNGKRRVFGTDYDAVAREGLVYVRFVGESDE